MPGFPIAKELGVRFHECGYVLLFSTFRHFPGIITTQGGAIMPGKMISLRLLSTTETRGIRVNPWRGEDRADHIKSQSDFIT